MRATVNTALVLGALLVAGVSLAHAQPFEAPAGTFYAMRVDPRGAAGLGNPGWGFGGRSTWHFKRPAYLGLEAGADGGNLDADDQSLLVPGSNVPLVLATSHDYLRMFGGVELAPPENDRRWVQPHLSVHALLVRQDVRVYQFDRTFGDFQEIRNDADTGLGWDATAGLAIRVTRRSRIDLGLGWMDFPAVDVEDSRAQTADEFVVYSIGIRVRLGGS